MGAFASEEYSPSHHLATLVCPSWMDRLNGLFHMLTFALDAGGHDNTAVLTVAGFGSSADDWDKFSMAWKERLQKADIEYFHAVDAAHFRGPFQHWHDRSDREQLRRDLFVDLMRILKSHVYRKFGSSIVNNSLGQMNPDLREEFSISAYSLAGRRAEQQIREWILADWTRTTPIAIVFEDGDKGKGKLQERLAKDGCFPPTFMLKKDTMRGGVLLHGFVPLQAADWLAYETSIAVQQIGKVDQMAELRWPMREFNRILGETRVYEAQALGDLEKNLDTIKAINEWEKVTGLDKRRDELRRARKS